MGICDDKEVFISTLPIVESRRGFEFLSSTSAGLIKLAQNYFELLWATSERQTP
jgi:hypothetical protein